MTLKDQLDALLDATAYDSTGTKIGAVRQVYVDDASGKITFATVSTGIFSSDAIVPLHGARLLDDELHVDHTRTVIRDSPRPDHTEDALTPDQEAKLLEYYGIEAPVRGREATQPTTTPADKAAKKSAPAATPAGESAAADTARENQTPSGETRADKARADKAPGGRPGGQAGTTPVNKGQGGRPGGGTPAPADIPATDDPATDGTAAWNATGGDPDATTTSSAGPRGGDTPKADSPRTATPAARDSGRGTAGPGSGTDRPADGDRAN